MSDIFPFPTLKPGDNDEMFFREAYTKNINNREGT